MPDHRAVIAIPTLNEAATIASVLADLRGSYPILVVDGGSSDGTKAIIMDVAERHGGVHLLHNPDRIQAAAMNMAATEAARLGAEILIRADAHARYPEGWVTRLIDAMDRTGADSVVVPMHTAGTGAMAILQNSWLGTGGARHRRTGHSGWVDHGHHAAFRLPVFRRLGGYDTRFAANEDAELDLRLRRAGHPIWLEASAPIDYLPRAQTADYARQMMRNGVWRARTAREHRRIGLRQLLPACAVLSALAGAILSPAMPGLAALPLGYLGLCLLLATFACCQAGRPRLAPAVLGLGVLGHASYALGLVRGVVTGIAAGRPKPRGVPT